MTGRWRTAAGGGVTLLLGLQLSASAVLACGAPIPLSPATLRGRWGFRMVPNKSFSASAPGDPGGVAGAPRQDILRVGVISFDQVGSVIGHALATTDDNTGNTVVINYGFSGTYTVPTDGVGTLSITPTVTDLSCTPPQPAGVCTTFEGPETYTLGVTRKRGITFTQTDNVGGGAKIFLKGDAIQQSPRVTPPFFQAFDLKRDWLFTLVPVTGFVTNAPGDPGGVAGAPQQDILRIGRITWDGFSGVTGHIKATTDDNAGNTIIIDYTFVGTYLVTADGTGTLNINPSVTDASCNPAQPAGVCATLEGPETYSIVIGKKNDALYLTQTDNAGGGAKIFLTGEAKFQ